MLLKYEIAPDLTWLSLKNHKEKKNQDFVSSLKNSSFNDNKVK